ncbi:unnamed protein product [Urochloa decumbens]|uniref:Peptidase C14 caspase domain-containing protein n=1 Tax=Urochloa decumbens TaxID=240449 RepID=A0ABC8VNT3_9POAL
MGQKRAVLVGINYPGTDGELKGCLNDVARMRRCLVERFGFEEAGIRVLADADPSTPPPTGANIRQELERLVEGARAGDTLFFHYSGHGLQLPAETGEDDDTGYDECIVPCDLNLIKDDDFTELVAKVPDGCLFTMVSDSCHSGGLIDKTKEQIGNSTKQSKAQQHRDRGMNPPPASCTCTPLLRIIHGAFKSLGNHLPCHGHKQKQSTQNSGNDKPDAKATEAEPSANAGVATTTSRSLPLPTFIEMLRDKTGRHDVGVGSIRTTLFHHFGHEASPKVKRFVKAMVARLRHDGKDVDAEHGHADGALEQEQDAVPVRGVEEVYAGPAARLPRNGVLISGCQTDETSADATTPEGVSYGALSDAIQSILAAGSGSGRKGRKRGAATVTNRELVVRARELMAKQGYTQHPGLYCSDEHAELPFIC